MLTLVNKRFLLGITGGIAAYKAAELCRELTRAGAEVRVVMTEAATQFVTPLTFQALSGNRVRTALLDTEAEAAMGHIELARWADLVLVAPASADFVARLAGGQADDLLTTVCLASSGPVALAPAMNQAMWENEQTQANIATLAEHSFHFFGPVAGDQACGETGFGRMEEPQAIAQAAGALFATGSLAGLEVTVTAGPTREAIDPVRFLGNRSSGRMGYAVARAAMEAGARVTLVSGPVNLAPPERVTVVNVESAQQMLEACRDRPGDIFIGVAAVADYRPRGPATGKIKKEDSDTLHLELVKTPDILATMAGLAQRPLCVGFAAETGDLARHAREKLRAKRLDLIFANDAAATFDSDEAALTAFWNGGEKSLEPAAKERAARQVIELINNIRGGFNDLDSHRS